MLVPGGSSVRRRGHGQGAGAHSSAPEEKPARRLVLPGRALAVALGLGLVLPPGLWLLTARPSPLPYDGVEVARALEFPDAGSAATPLPVKSTPAAAAPAQARATKGAPLKKKPQHTTPDGTMGKLLGTTAACVGLACAGAQVRPADADCPAESRTVMKELGMYWGDGPTIITDIQQGEPGPTEDQIHAIVRSGPIISRMFTDYGRLPEGTLLFGELFTEAENVYGRYDRAQTPDGKTYPVCFTLGNEAEDGLEKLPGSQPGAAHISRAAPITAVKRFVFKEPRKEQK